MLDLLEETCRGCGCTDDDACWDEETKGPCHWVKSDLCSLCAQKLEPEA